MTTSSDYIFPRPCSSLCRRKAILNLEINDSVSLPLCTTCWKIIDPDGDYLFELITEDEEEKEVEN
jgi:hypothetical protein